jgi:phage terminase large subunit
VNGSQQLQRWRAQPALWVRDHVDFAPACYRDRADLAAWLATQPADTHTWIRQQLAQGRLVLDPQRSYQAEILDRMAPPGKYALCWANAAGKTTVAALFVLWFLDCFPGGKVVTTAASAQQLSEQLWTEIRRVYRLSHDTIIRPEDLRKTAITVDVDWFAIGRAAHREETFEGVHGEYVLLVIDEAKGVPAAVFDAGRRILRGGTGHYWWLCVSSPGGPSGPFYDLVEGKAASQWTVSRLSAYGTERMPLAQIEEDAESLGEEAPLFASMVLGQFPRDDEDALIPRAWVAAAVNRVMDSTAPPVLGVDIARKGKNETVFCRLEGLRAELVQAYRGRDLMHTVGLIQRLAPSVQAIAVDAAGLGGGVVDRCRELEIRVQALNAGQRAGKANAFANAGAEMAWALREAFEETYQHPDDPTRGLSIPDDPTLIHQLSTRRYGYTSDGRVQVESKDALAQRGENSPDRADALMLAWWVRGQPDQRERHRALMEVNAKATHRGYAWHILNDPF